jgi:hypothetical protein
MSIWGTVLKGIVGDGIGNNIVDYYKKKAELKQALHERKLELIKEGLHADAAWEIEQIKNSGWKDEFVLILLSIPLIGVFIPKMQPYVLNGFAILETTPAWYRWLILAIFTAIYGIRIWRRQLSDT